MPIQRREFLKTASMLTSGLALAMVSNKIMGCKTPSVKASAINENFGLQLYTLRADMPKDPKGILQQVASFGYKQIESYEGAQGIFWGMKNTEFKSFLDGLGMQMISSHCDINKNFEQKADEAAAIGVKYLIAPYLGAQKELDFYKKAAERFNQCGNICKQRGMRFAYHNHDYSFKPVENELPQDVMMQMTDKDSVDYEMDIYWVVTAGQDPVFWFNKYPDRFRLCHVKDRMKNAPASEGDASTTLGQGMINYPEILNVARKKGMQYFIVEQEKYEGTTPLQAVKDNALYMKNLKFA
jgi:sugar phosphate isomerase/epimerase